MSIFTAGLSFFTAGWGRMLGVALAISPDASSGHPGLRSLRAVCTFVIPILLVVNVPARVIAQPFSGTVWWPVAGMIAAAGAALVVSRWVFQRSLAKYRSASS